MPVRFDALGHLFFCHAAQWQQPLFDPVGQADIGQHIVPRQDMGDGFRQIADGLVALVEQPVGDAGHLAGQHPQAGRWHHLAWLAAGQEVDRPSRVPCAGFAEIALQRFDLGIGRGRRIEFSVQAGELLHNVGRSLLVAYGFWLSLVAVAAAETVAVDAAVAQAPSNCSATADVGASAAASTFSSIESSPYSVSKPSASRPCSIR